MNQFEKAIKDGDIDCDICGKPMIIIHGGGWDYDIIYCSDRDCGAEINYPTSTIYHPHDGKPCLGVGCPYCDEEESIK